MIPNKAIELAIDGGWKDAESFEVPALDYGTYSLTLKSGAKIHLFQEVIALDPAFWKALGKALGWDSEDVQNQRLYEQSGGGGRMPTGIRRWHKRAHRFYDLILIGQSTDRFWEDLLAAAEKRAGDILKADGV